MEIRKPIRIAYLGVCLSILGLSLAQGGDLVIDSFSGLNSQDNPFTIGQNEAADLLNCNITPGGKSVYKREGYGLDKAFTWSTSPVHGVYHFQDSVGNEIRLVGQDIGLQSIVSGGTPVQVSTGTPYTTWQCTDNGGYAYCLTSNHDTAVRTDGTAGGTTFQGGIPLGSMVTSTPDRLLVAGVSGNPTRIYYSQANTFTNFTVGPLNTDAGYEDISGPGSRLTHIRYACGKWLWWKDQSFGYVVGDNQYNLEIFTISPNIGTLDNDSDEYNGNVYFRGQDNHIYVYDCSNVTRLSRQITPSIGSANRRKANSWTLTTLADWQSTSWNPSQNLSATYTAGDLTLTSFTKTNTAQADFVVGVSSNITFQSGNLIVSTNAVQLPDNDFESGLTWIPGDITASIPGQTCTVTPKSGSYLNGSVFGNYSAHTVYATLIDSVTGTSYGSTSWSYANNCSWIQKTLTVSSTANRRRVYLKFYTSTTSPPYADLLSDPFISNGNNITFWTAGVYWCAGVPTCVNKYGGDAIDLVEGTPRSTITSGWYRSETFDIGLSSPSVYVTADWTTLASTPIFSVIKATATTGPWTSLLTSSGATSQGTRYVRYTSTISVDSTGNALSTLDDVSIVGRSTWAIVHTPVSNAPLITVWDTFGISGATNDGSLTYYTRAANGAFTQFSSTPAWVAQTANATVATSTGTYIQAKVVYGISVATQNPTINDLSFNWFEGNASDKSYIKYFNDHVWISVSSGTGGTNNRVFRWDTINNTWLLDDIAANGFAIENDNLYFGSPTGGYLYKFGGVPTDNAAAIHAYWKSKNFGGDDPFVQNNWDSSDTIVKASTGTLSVTYTLDGSSVTTYSLNLYDPSKSILRLGKQLPGYLGTYVNVKFEDTSSYPAWEVMGHRMRYTAQPWRP